MLVSYRWLLDLCPVEAPAEQVARWLTARGLTVDAIDGDSVEGDVVLDVDVPANRPDCLGHRGIARELSAASGVAMAAPSPPPAASGDPVTAGFAIRIEEPAACGRFTGTLVRGVRVGPSPDWIRRRLVACGLRSVNNVVDVSNLVMLEIGQPVHFYDAHTLRGPRLIARRARPSETVRTLDGEVRELDAATLVIADADRAVGIAGVMGGAETEIGETSRDVLVEAAWFRPESVRRTRRALGMSTDAGYRFERGCDPEAPLAAQALACRWLAETCNGSVAPGVIDVRGELPSPARHRLRAHRLSVLLGFDPGPEAVREALDAIGFEVRETSEGWDVTAPTWRVDIDGEAALVEEVARHVGYDRVPSHLPPMTGAPAPGSTHPLDEPVRTLLAHLGFHEAFNYAMVACGEDDRFAEPDWPAAISLGNPIADTLARLRRSVIPGLVAASDRNLRRGARDVRLFEVGRVFRGPGSIGQLPDEPLRAGFAWAGGAAPPHWSAESREVDVYDAAGVVERILAASCPGVRFERRPTERFAGLHPGQSLEWRHESVPVAWAGMLHPDVRAELDLPRSVAVAEVDLDRLRAISAPGIRHRPVPRVPSTSRDLSLVLSPGTSYADVLAAATAVPPPAPVTFEVVDRYVGDPLEEGEVSLTVRVILQPQDRTLTDERSEAYREALVGALEATGTVRLRS